jgi:guanylate kinase
VKQSQRLIFVISGPSGSGKTTLLKSLLGKAGLKNRLLKSTSFTTRPKRSGEKDGKDYSFISEKEFKQKRQTKKLLEWTRYLGYYYATPKEFIERQLAKDKYSILCLDFKGALKIKQLYPKNTVMIFVMPPSLEVLRERVTKRSQKTKEEKIARRINLAKKELLAASQYDYCVLNTDLRLALKQLKNIILNKISPARNTKSLRIENKISNGINA